MPYFLGRFVQKDEVLKFSDLGQGTPRFQFIFVRGPENLRRLPPEKAGVGLLFGVATRATARGREEDLGYIKALWTDFCHTAAVSVLEVRQRTGVPHISAVVADGHGAHFYRVWKGPLDLRDRLDLEVARSGAPMARGGVGR